MSGVRTAIAIAMLAFPASSAAQASDALSAPEPVARSCEQRLLPAGADGADRAEWVAPASGYFTTELRGGSVPDWDLAMFRLSDGEPVAASSSFTSDEKATAWVEPGDRIAIQACRLEGALSSVPLHLDLYEYEPPNEPAERISLESVTITGPEDLERLEALGTDVTHDVGPGSATVATYSNQERARLAGAGFDFFPLVRDLAAADANARVAEDATPAAAAAALPSGRTEYRTYDEYTTELKQLADENPGLVRSVKVGETYEGRPIEGVEIAAGVERDDDGRPVYLNFGLHHAREWPSGELPMEFAIDLVDGWRAGDARVQALLEEVRVIVVPVVNVDGFIASRSYSFNPLTDDDSNLTLAQSVANQAAYIRKNCRPTLNDGAIPCALRTGSGVDLNRNYGAYWGGPGASTDPTAQSYRGTGPYSEPESAAVREFTSRLHPTVFITNHTFTDDGKWLRQPGFDAPFLAQTPIAGYTTGDGGAITPDEAAMQSLGDEMASATGWTSELGYETLCDITGATEDWNYFSQGTYGYTPEARGDNFHATYSTMVVDEYAGDATHAGLGVREAFLVAGERAADAAEHGVIEGEAPAGATLRLHKEFETPTCEDSDCTEGDGGPIHDVLDTRLTVPASGEYEWHVGPSGRPLAPGETWTMSCKAEGGTEVSREVAVGRGQRVTIDWASCAPPEGPGEPPVDPPSDPPVDPPAEPPADSPGEPPANPPATPADQSPTAPGPTERASCGNETATIVGTSGADRLRGTRGPDVISARGGDDEVRALAGNDVVCGGGGADSIRAGAGADGLYGGSGADRLNGGPGTDRCAGESGRDKLTACG